jgi:hypothetical protein
VDRRRNNYQLRNEQKNIIKKKKNSFSTEQFSKNFYLKNSKFKNILMAKNFGTGSQGP